MPRGDYYAHRFRRRTDERTPDRHRERDVSGSWRDEYRAQHAPVPDGGQASAPDLPEPGDRVRDRDAADDAELLVLDVHRNTAAADHPIGALDGTTVAEVNPEYDESAPVVDAVYLDELEALEGWRSLDDVRAAVDADAVTAYSFPADRLATVDAAGAGLGGEP